jgi:hypothetical protein
MFVAPVELYETAFHAEALLQDDVLAEFATPTLTAVAVPIKRDHRA